MVYCSDSVDYLGNSCIAAPAAVAAVLLLLVAQKVGLCYFKAVQISCRD